jgi:hypothetical protein
MRVRACFVCAHMAACARACACVLVLVQVCLLVGMLRVRVVL